MQMMILFSKMMLAAVKAYAMANLKATANNYNAKNNKPKHQNASIRAPIANLHQLGYQPVAWLAILLQFHMIVMT